MVTKKTTAQSDEAKNPDAELETPKTKASKSDASHLVTVTKDGQSLDVHPDAVAAHQAAGWTLAE